MKSVCFWFQQCGNKPRQFTKLTVDWLQGTFVPARPRKVQWHHRAGATPSAGWTPSPNDEGSMRVVPSDRWLLYLGTTDPYIYIIYIYLCVCAWYIYMTYTCIYDICSRELKHVLKIYIFTLAGVDWRVAGSWMPVLLDVVVTQRASILQLLPREDQALLIWWDAWYRWRGECLWTGPHVARPHLDVQFNCATEFPKIISMISIAFDTCSQSYLHVERRLPCLESWP